MGIKMDSDWGCGDGSGCGNSNTQKWGPNSIYDVECPKCNTKIEFFKDEKKRTCPNCDEKVFNENVGKDCC